MAVPANMDVFVTKTAEAVSVLIYYSDDTDLTCQQGDSAKRQAVSTSHEI